MSADTAVIEKTEEEIPEEKRKISKAETGLAKNAANFTAMVIAVKTFGEQYNPSAEALTVKGLEALRDKADQSLEEVRKADTAYKDAVNKRQTAFEGLSGLTTNIKRSAEAAGVDPKVLDELTSITRKITGVKVVKDKDQTGGKSVSQMSIDNRTSNFMQLLTRLATVPEYKPNESELTLASLNAYVETLKTMTDELENAQKLLTRARAERDNIMSKDNDSLVQVAGRVKKYVLSVFQAKSPEYKSIKNLKFKKIKIK